MPVADRIKKLRKKNKLSQKGLAALLGVSRSSVNGWELGFNMPSTQYISQLPPTKVSGMQGDGQRTMSMNCTLRR